MARKNGNLASYDMVVNYLLVNNSKDDKITDTDPKINRSKQV